MNLQKKWLLQSKAYIMVKRVGFTLLSFFSVFSVLKGQNLIRNPSFEQISACPDGFSQINRVLYWQDARSQGTADFYHECATANLLRLPYKYQNGEQKARTGQSLLRIAVYCDERFAYWGFHEYIRTELIKSMRKGKVYYLQFYTLPQERPLGNFQFFSDAIGMALVDSFVEYEYVSTTEGQIIPLEPKIEHRGELITDYEHWTRINGSYIASGKEKEVIIGNFRLNTETMTYLGSLDIAPYLKFNFVDDVLVMEFNPVPDTVVLCEAEGKVELGGSFLDGRYLWSTGEIDSVITVRAPGQYVVEVTIDDVVMYDTTQVILVPKPYDYQLDTSVCADELLTIQPNIVGSYLWNDGAVDATRILDHTGDYDLTITNRCGEFYFAYEMGIENCDCPIFVPNVFSPNNDGINDVFEFYPNCDYPVQFLSLTIFDRWGSMVYQSNDLNELVWDGRSKGQLLDNGVYIWVLNYELIKKGQLQSKIMSGDVAIIR